MAKKRGGKKPQPLKQRDYVAKALHEGRAGEFRPKTIPNKKKQAQKEAARKNRPLDTGDFFVPIVILHEPTHIRVVSHVARTVAKLPF